MLKLALYKGPPSGIIQAIGWSAIRTWTWSKYSHAELVIDGVCWSSSARDHGVRRKIIDLNSGKWDVFDITDNPQVKAQALSWFIEHEGDSYDYRNIVRFVLPLFGHNKRHWVCFEACGEALGIPKSYKLDADELLRKALLMYKQ